MQTRGGGGTCPRAHCLATPLVVVYDYGRVQNVILMYYVGKGHVTAAKK